VAGHLAAIDMQGLAGDEAGGLQIEHGVGDVRHLAHMADRMQLAQEIMGLGACIGLLMIPGDTAFTRMPRLAYSIAIDLVAAARPPLVSDARTDGTLELA